MDTRSARRIVSYAGGGILAAIACVGPAAAIAPIACGKPVAMADGTHGPVLCPNGAPNRQMRAWLIESAPHTMALKAKVTDAQIRKAACNDVALEKATGPLVTDAYTYQYALNNWRGVHIKPAVFDLRLGVEFNCGD